MRVRARGKIPPKRAALIADKTLTIEIVQASSIDELLAIVRGRKGQLTGVSAAACLYQLAKKEKHISEDDAESPEVRGLLDAVLDLSVEMDPPGLSNVAWSVVYLQPKLGDCVLDLVPAIAEQSTQRIAQFTPRYSSTTAWALARMGYNSTSLFEQMADVFLRDIEEESNGQDLSCMAYSLAKMGVEKMEVMNAIADRAVSIIDDIDPEALGKLVWSFGKFAAFEIRSKAFLDAAAERADSLIGSLTQQSCRQIAWGYWRLGFRKPQLVRRICAAMRGESGRRGHPVSDSAFRWATPNTAFYWATVMSAAAEVGVLDEATVDAGAKSLLQPGLLREATRYSVAALFRVAEMERWWRTAPGLHDALTREVQTRGITQKEWDNALIVDPQAWTDAFGWPLPVVRVVPKPAT